MWNFQRIICIWICCVSCMFGTTQLSSLVQAVPYEYFDDHDQSFYDLDTEQIQAKYDTRLLSQQMINSEQQQHQQQQYLAKNKKDSKTINIGAARNGRTQSLTIKDHNDADVPLNMSSKLQQNDGHTTMNGQDETATVRAALTAVTTEKVEDLYLPRAASCYTNGQKYTHGQKVPRLDSCEVCLCMDGEIFCWWEKCDKKPATLSATYDDYSTPFEETSTTRIQSNAKSTYKTTLKPKAKTSKLTVAVAVPDYKYDEEDSKELREMQQEYEGLKEQLMTKKQQYKNHNKQMVKKKIYQQQEEKKHTMKMKEQQTQKKQQEQQQSYKRQHKANEQAGQHHHMHTHHEYGSSSGTNKILNFPENLPSVLYYDYKTEEHHQHQHQHHEQHLKHQKQLQHEKELKHRQQQQEHEQEQQQQKQKHHHINRHHEYGQDFNTYPDEMASTPTWPQQANDGNGGGSSNFKYYSNGNDNIHNNVDLQTDSDILPEPPTKKPKLSVTSQTTTTATAESSAYHMSSSTLTTSSSSSSSSTARPLKKQVFSPWDYGKPNRNKVNNNINNNNESTEDSDNQDDAFHRWLTSTETNNKNNSTVNGGNNEGSAAVVVVVTNNGALLASSNSDYNVDDKNYENIDIDIETGTGALPPTSMQLTLTTATTTATATVIEDMNANMKTATATTTAARATEVGYGEDIKQNQNLENSRTSKYEQDYVENKSNNNNNNNDNILEENINMDNSNSNGNGNNNISPFSNPYQNYNDNNKQKIINPSSSSSISSSQTSESASSSASNEDNGVAGVVNIDIMLTASSTDLQQQQQQQDPLLNSEKSIHPQEQLQNFEHENQISSTQLKFVQPPVLISNTNDVDNNKLLSSLTNDNSDNTTTNIVGGPNAKPPKAMGVNLLSSNSSNHTTTSNINHGSSSSQTISDSYKFKNLSTATANFVHADAGPTTAVTPALNTTLSPERLCNVMGTLYRIGDVLPQDTGNCLQCICIDGSTSDDTPRVTCSPHNCPPLVLPDLFDATGY